MPVENREKSRSNNNMIKWRLILLLCPNTNCRKRILINEMEAHWHPVSPPIAVNDDEDAPPFH